MLKWYVLLFFHLFFLERLLFVNFFNVIFDINLLSILRIDRGHFQLASELIIFQLLIFNWSVGIQDHREMVWMQSGLRYSHHLQLTQLIKYNDVQDAKVDKLMRSPF